MLPYILKNMTSSSYLDYDKHLLLCKQLQFEKCENCKTDLSHQHWSDPKLSKYSDIFLFFFKLFFVPKQISVKLFNASLGEKWNGHKKSLPEPPLYSNFCANPSSLGLPKRSNRVLNEEGQNITVLKIMIVGWEPWSSGYERRLIFRRLWVQIPAPYTRWAFFIHTPICSKNCNVCLKRLK